MSGVQFAALKERLSRQPGPATRTHRGGDQNTLQRSSLFLQRERLHLAGRIDHDQLFFQKNGAPLRSLLYPASRWRRTLRKLPIRYRKPYSARHSSVSWNLMIGKNPLWTAKQHGHSIATMFRVYSAWMEGALDSDIDAIKSAMRLDSVAIQASTDPKLVAQKSRRTESTVIRTASHLSD